MDTGVPVNGTFVGHSWKGIMLRRTTTSLALFLALMASGCIELSSSDPAIQFGWPAPSQADRTRQTSPADPPTPPTPTSHPSQTTDVASCDVRIVRVADGSVVASATGRAPISKLEGLAKALADKLRRDVFVKGESIAVLSLRDRSGTKQGRAAADELADKLTGSLADTGWFEVKERVDLRALLEEKDLESAGIVKRENVREKLADIRYVVIGGVTVTTGSL